MEETGVVCVMLLLVTKTLSILYKSVMNDGSNLIIAFSLVLIKFYKSIHLFILNLMHDIVTKKKNLIHDIA